MSLSSPTSNIYRKISFMLTYCEVFFEHQNLYGFLIGFAVCFPQSSKIIFSLLTKYKRKISVYGVLYAIARLSYWIYLVNIVYNILLWRAFIDIKMDFFSFSHSVYCMSSFAHLKILIDLIPHFVPNVYSILINESSFIAWTHPALKYFFSLNFTCRMAGLPR